MMLQNPRCFQLAALAAAALFLCSGCAENSCVCPGADTGSAVINSGPDSVSAPWTLSSSAGFSESGTGDQTVRGLEPGDYTLTWGEVSGWVAPLPDVMTVRAGETATFSGIYGEDSGATGFVLIAPGIFEMGSPEAERGRDEDETQHTVTVTQAFYMSATEVTLAWWDEVMGDGSETSRLPKNYVSWDAAVDFCNALSEAEGLTPAYTIDGPDGDVTWDREADGYRLPTEAEWEFACRAESTTGFTNGAITVTGCGDPALDEVGWYCGNAGDVFHGVGQLSPNAWGLYDLHGNLSEWCWDGYSSDYESLPQEDPVADGAPGQDRVIRGGFWGHGSQYCRSANRYFLQPGNGFDYLGFRPVRSAL